MAFGVLLLAGNWMIDSDPVEPTADIMIETPLASN